MFHVSNSGIYFPSLGVSMKKLTPYNKNFDSLKSPLYFSVLPEEKRIKCRHLTTG